MKKEMAKNRVNEQVKAILIKEAHDAEKQLNDGVKHLKDSDIFVTSVSMLHKINEDWLRQFVNKSKSDFFGSQHGYLPPAVRQKFEHDFESVFDNNLSSVTMIQNILTKYKYTVEAGEDGVFSFRPEEIEAEATKRATETYDEDTRKYYSLLASLVEKVNEITDFENSHQFPNFVLNGVELPTFGAAPYRSTFIEELSDGHGALTISEDKFISLRNFGAIAVPKL